MKKLILLVAVCLCSVVILAENVTQERAQQIGLAFLSSMVHSVNQPMQVQTNITTGTTNLSANGLSNLYLVNSAAGWVILSNDTRVQPILAYSATSNKLNIDNIPEGLMELLSSYDEDIRYVKSNIPDSIENSQWHQLATEFMSTSTTNRKVLERCTQVLWNQNENNDRSCTPSYNMLCPTFYTPRCGHTYVGCTAVAMAQIMWYYKWPYSAVVPDSISMDGTPSEECHFQLYDWDLMPPTLRYNTPNNEAKMITTLLRDCGYAAKMKYRAEGSSASLENAMNALSHTFGYKGQEMSHKQRSTYVKSNWIQKLKNEIDANRPVLYAAWQNSDSGHSFVIDGYEGDMFHINWGWADALSNNAFYSLNSLLPKTDEGKTGALAYNDYHEAVFGIAPFITNSMTSTGTQNFGPLVRAVCSGILLEEYIVPAPYDAYFYSNTQVRITDGCWFKAGSKVHIAIKDLPCGDYSSTQNTPAVHKSPSIENEEDTTGDSGSDITNQIQTSTIIDHIAVYSISGQLLHTIYGADTNLSSLPSGFYVLQKHMTDGSVVSETIVKN